MELADFVVLKEKNGYGRMLDAILDIAEYRKPSSIPAFPTIGHEMHYKATHSGNGKGFLLAYCYTSPKFRELVGKNSQSSQEALIDVIHYLAVEKNVEQSSLEKIILLLKNIKEPDRIYKIISGIRKNPTEILEKIKRSPS